MNTWLQEFSDLLIADPSLELPKKFYENTICNKIYFIKVQRIQQNSYNFEPEMENPAQRLQNLQMKY